MATIKSYTTIEQSRKLAEILPLESADMRYEYPSKEKDEIQEPMNGFHISSFNWFKESNSFIYFPCWSLAALLSILPDMTCVYKKTYKDGRIKYQGVAGGIKDLILKDNPVDACYEIIIKLKENELI